MSTLSPRPTAIVEAIPSVKGRACSRSGERGAAAKAVAGRLGEGHALMIDRSARGIALERRNAAAEIEAGRLSLRQVAVEDFELLPGEAPFDLAFAVRVGALDGRHPRAGAVARRRIAAALTAEGRLSIDCGDPLRELELPRRPRA